MIPLISVKEGSLLWVMKGPSLLEKKDPSFLVKLDPSSLVKEGSPLTVTHRTLAKLALQTLKEKDVQEFGPACLLPLEQE